MPTLEPGQRSSGLSPQADIAPPWSGLFRVRPTIRHLVDNRRAIVGEHRRPGGITVQIAYTPPIFRADMAELAYALGLGSSTERFVGSSPTVRTIFNGAPQDMGWRETQNRRMALAPPPNRS